MSAHQSLQDALDRVFADQGIGFYVDIGGRSEELPVATRSFYERGWSGINVVTDPARLDAVANERPRDTNLCAEIRCTDFHSDVGPQGRSGGGDAVTAAQGHEAGSFRPCISLREVIDRRPGAGSEIDFMKIGAAGFELAVIASGDWSRHRPKLVVIAFEAGGLPLNYRQVDDHLQAVGYRLALFDGADAMYCRIESAADLLPRLGVPSSIFGGWLAVRERQLLDEVAHAKRALHALEVQCAGLADKLKLQTRRADSLDVEAARSRRKETAALDREAKAEERLAELEMAGVRDDATKRVRSGFADPIFRRAAAKRGPVRVGLFSLLRRQDAIRKARRAMRGARWSEAERHYRTAYRFGGFDGRLWVQFGHALKEQDDLDAAAHAYRAALAASPGLGDTQQHLDNVVARLRFASPSK